MSLINKLLQLQTEAKATKLKNEKIYLFIIVAFIVSVLCIVFFSFALKSIIASIDWSIATWRH